MGSGFVVCGETQFSREGRNGRAEPSAGEATDFVQPAHVQTLAQPAVGRGHPLFIAAASAAFQGADFLSRRSSSSVRPSLTSRAVSSSGQSDSRASRNSRHVQRQSTTNYKA